MDIKKELVAIVLNYNNYKQTISVINQLNEFGILTVLVDNASTNDSWEILTECCKNKNNITAIRSETNGGYSKGNNIGIRYAIENMFGIKYIAILNPDIEFYEKNDLIKLCKALENDEELAGITALTVLNNRLNGVNTCADKLVSDKRLIIAHVTAIARFFPAGYKTLIAYKNNVAYVDRMQGCFFIMKKDIFEQVGYLDENVFLYFEEDILAYKIKQLGYKCGVLINTCIKHNHIVKDNEMTNLAKRKFHNKCMLDSKKYYMLSIRKTPKWIWALSFLLDWTTRKIKDIALKIKFNSGV